MAARAAKSSRPGPRPRGPFVDKRKAFNTRVTERTKTGLEEAARRADRSLSQEIELRLEKSLEEDAVFGGTQFRHLFEMFGRVAVRIEQKTGKSCFEHWDTWVAVQAAWKRLGVPFGPLPSKKFLKMLSGSVARLADLPEPPPEDADSAVWEAYRAEFDKQYEAGMDYYHYAEEERAQKAIGEEMAIELLPESKPHPDFT